MIAAPRTVSDWARATIGAIADELEKTRLGATPVAITRAFVQGYRQGRAERIIAEFADQVNAAREAFQSEQDRHRQGERSSVRVKPIVAWYNAWVGVFVDAPKRRVYVMPVPFVGLQLDFDDPEASPSKPSEPSKHDPTSCSFFLLMDEFGEEEEQIYTSFEAAWGEAKAANEHRSKYDEFPSLFSVYGVVHYGIPYPDKENDD